MARRGRSKPAPLIAYRVLRLDPGEVPDLAELRREYGDRANIRVYVDEDTGESHVSIVQRL
jgi:hypothetical protein